MKGVLIGFAGLILVFGLLACIPVFLVAVVLCCPFVCLVFIFYYYWKYRLYKFNMQMKNAKRN